MYISLCGTDRDHLYTKEPGARNFCESSAQHDSVNVTQNYIFVLNVGRDMLPVPEPLNKVSTSSRSSPSDWSITPLQLPLIISMRLECDVCSDICDWQQANGLKLTPVFLLVCGGTCGRCEHICVSLTDKKQTHCSSACWLSGYQAEGANKGQIIFSNSPVIGSYYPVWALHWQ